MQLAEATASNWSQVMNKGDVGALSAIYREDALVTAPTDELLDGRQAIAGYWDQAVKSGNRYFTNVEAANLQGDSLYEAGIWAAEIKTGAATPQVVGGNFVRVLDRQADGSWSIRLETWHRNPR
jgi:ketosteroid isomerase-like protein